MKYGKKLLLSFLAVAMISVQVMPAFAVNPNGVEETDEYTEAFESDLDESFDDDGYLDDGYLDEDSDDLEAYPNDTEQEDDEQALTEDGLTEDGSTEGDFDTDVEQTEVDDDYPDEAFEDLCPIEPLGLSAETSYVPEMLFSDHTLEYAPTPEECIGIAPLNATPGGAGSGLVQFVLEPVGTLPSGVTRAQLMNVITVTHPLFADGTTTATATAVNGAFGRDAIFLGRSANGNRYRVMISGFVGYVNRRGAEHTVNVNGRSVRVRANAVFVPFNNYPNAGSGSVRSMSHYVNRNGELWRYLSTNVNNTSFQRFLTGPAPSWMTQNRRYYSYDGVYFYRNPRNIRANGSGAVNASNPHFNYFQYLSFRSTSTVTAAQLNNFLNNQSLHGINTSNSVMRGRGNLFINAQNRYGTNALLMYSKAMLESAGGTSFIARNNNNLFGQGAVDAAPTQNAMHFPNPAASVNNLANGWLSRGYLWPNDWRYEGPHVGHKGSGMNVRYATDPYWGQKIAGWAFRIDRSRPSGSRDRNREQIAIRRNTSSVSVQNAAGTRLYTANPRGARYFPFLVTGTSGDRLRILTDPAIVNGSINRTARFNRNNARGYIPNTNVWRVGASRPRATGTATATNQPLVTLQLTGVTRRSVPLRRGPGTNYGQIRTVNPSTNLRITGRRGSWYRVSLGGRVGWIRRTAVARTRQHATVTTNNAHVRAMRGVNHRSLTRVPKGHRFTITQRTGNWSRITVNGHTGWIRNRDLQVSSATRPGRTRVNDVRVHTRPEAGADVRRRLPRNTQLMIVQRTTDGWSQIRIHHSGGTFHGWVRTNQIQARVHSRRLVHDAVLRSGPGTNFRNTRVLPRNTRVIVRSRVGRWYHVQATINGRRVTGWQYRDNLERLRLP